MLGVYESLYQKRQPFVVDGWKNQMEMEFYAYPSRVLPFSSSICSFCIRDLVDKAKDFFTVAISAIIGSVFSAIFTFFFALGAYTLLSLPHNHVFAPAICVHINSRCCFDAL